MLIHKAFEHLFLLMSYCDLLLLQPLVSCCRFLSYCSKNIKLCILLKHMGGDNLTEANSCYWQAWSGVRLAQDCYMVVDGLAQEILILLFSKAVYLNVGYGFLVHCSRYLLSRVSLVCELLPSEAEGAFWNRQRIVSFEACGEDLHAFKQTLLSYYHQGYFVPGPDACVAPAAVSCKLPCYSSICSNKIYWRLDTDTEKVAPGYLMMCHTL